ncbi:MAG: GNAT family N-acetyltransferase [Bacilli bacterium]
MIVYHPVDDLAFVCALWNREVGFIYPIADDVFSRNVINYPTKRVFGAYDETQLVGFIITKTSTDSLLPAYLDRGWISLFYVAKKYRYQGIGSTLLRQAEDVLADKKEIWVGSDLFNFFPGVPTDFDNLTDVWLTKRGYYGSRSTHDMIIRSFQDLPIRNYDIEFSVATKIDEVGLIELLKTFSDRWAQEGIRYFEAGGTGREYVIAKDQGKIIAFARINDREAPFGGYNITWYPRFVNLGGVGPLGVNKIYQGRGLGNDIVVYALKEMQERKMIEVMIDWTGLVSFYQQFGFEVWKTYKYMSKKS